MSDTSFLAAGIILSVIGILFIFGAIISGRNCKAAVSGTVAGLKDKTFYHRGITTHNITPVVKYTYNGKSFENKADVSTSNKKKYHIGDSIKVFVNPKRPEEFMLGKTVWPYVFGAIFLIPGAVLIRCYFM